MKMTKQILEGIKILEFAWVGVGPQVGRELAEHGATVIRVESHTRPDPSGAPSLSGTVSAVSTAALSAPPSTPTSTALASI